MALSGEDGTDMFEFTHGPPPQSLQSFSRR